MDVRQSQLGFSWQHLGDVVLALWYVMSETNTRSKTLHGPRQVCHGEWRCCMILLECSPCHSAHVMHPLLLISFAFTSQADWLLVGLHKLWEPCQCPWLNKLGPRRGHSLQLYAGFSHSDCWWHLDEVPTTGTQTASQTPRCFYRRMRIHQHHWSASAEHYIIIWKPKKVMCPTIYKQRTI